MRNLHLAVAAVLLLCALATCTSEDSAVVDRHKAHIDAGVTVVDATPPTGGVGAVTCYAQANPTTTCAQPEHCCFSNYSAQHDGACTTASCAYGTIDCDGPEDCATGERCCSHALVDPNEGLVGYAVACQASACGAAPLDYELCHPDGPACPNGSHCVTAFGNDNDLPRTLYLCK